MVRHHHSLGKWVDAKYHQRCALLKILFLIISTASSSPTSYSSSSYSAPIDDNRDQDSDVNPTSNPPSKYVTDFDVECGCDALQQIRKEVRETKGVCIDTALAVNTHIKKVNKLQIGVDGIASIRDINHADKIVAPTSPSTDTVSSSDDVPLSVSSLSSPFHDVDIEIDSTNENSAPGIDRLGIEKPPSILEGVQLVVMEPPDVIPRDCLEVQQAVGNVSGVYTILPDGCGQPFQVFCDMATAGGGWTVLQRRLNGEVSFARLWGAYRRGFGNLLTEFWMGLDKMSRLTSQDDYELRIDVQDFNGTKAAAEYESVMISDYRSNYRLHVGSFKVNGSAGDSLSYHNHMPFTTTDRDNDLAKKNCAELYSGGGWWFNGCLYSNLNGIYHGPDDDDFASGVTWYKFAGFRNSLKFAEMKVRPVP